MLNKTYNVVKIYAELALYYMFTTDLNDKINCIQVTATYFSRPVIPQ